MTVAGYQFPKLETDEDANWLLINTEASIGGRFWYTRDACLLTWELAGLADWLEALAGEHEWAGELGFLEPNLRFVLIERSKDCALIRTYFELENRPTWAPGKAAGLDDLWIELRASPSDLQEASTSLRSCLSNFPYRGMGECPTYPITRSN